MHCYYEGSLIYCTLLLLACQVRVIVGDSGFCCCVCVMSLEHKLTPLFVDVVTIMDH